MSIYKETEQATCLHGLAPVYLLSEFKHAHQIHSYNTRGRNLLCPPSAHSSKYQGSFRISDVRAYNALPWRLRQLYNFKEFKLKLKRHLKN